MKELEKFGMLPADDEPAKASRGPSFRNGWQVLPLDGAFEFSYLDAAGAPSLRKLVAHELKIGPGKTLLGGTDVHQGAYRGFRADRINVIEDVESGETVDRNVLDWLLRKAMRQDRERRRTEAAAARVAFASRPTTAAAS